MVIRDSLYIYFLFGRLFQYTDFSQFLVSMSVKYFLGPEYIFYFYFL